MPKLTADTKARIKELNRKDLEAIVLKFAAKDKFMLGYLTVHYLNPGFGEQDLFDETIEDLNKLLLKSYKGRTIQMQLSRMLTACLKRVAEFVKIVKDKKREADLLSYILDTPLNLPERYFGSFYRTYDNQMVRLVTRLVKVVETELHEDYRMEYRDKLNQALSVLHRNCGYLPKVGDLPKQI